ncbi:MAG: urease accessory protein UreF [Myxococcales bacterium]|nr:urease accessory protein UreF [Myxococcales bacterium]MCB9642373.1 urease accessory protein UreF [Myxococcales bacterium]
MQISALLSLLHLSSPSLPIGAFAYSQGLEGAVELGWVKDEASLREWLRPLLESAQATLDVPLFKRFYEAWQDGDRAQIHQWQDILLAYRETAELVMEEQNLGKTLLRLLQSLGVTIEQNDKSLSYLPLYAKACQHFQVPLKEAVAGWLWSWLENQVTVACKTVPLGQTSAQKVLLELMPAIEQAITTGLAIEDDEIGLTLPNFAMVSAWHETQYSRLFRS